MKPMGSVFPVSVVVPAHNEEESIGEVLKRIEKLRGSLLMEVIVVDDGSTDRTAEVAKRFPYVQLISHRKSRGKGAALKTGLKHAKGKIIVFQDADFEYLPEDIPALLKPLITDQADVVYGNRFRSRPNGMSFAHYIGNRVLSLTTRILFKKRLTDMMTGYKVFTRKVLEDIQLTEDDFKIEAEISAKVLKNGWRVAEVPISYSYRRAGIAKIDWKDGINSMFKLIEERFF
jgi:glycosyltransferase involved in cell wall biosynthesis